MLASTETEFLRFVTQAEGVLTRVLRDLFLLGESNRVPSGLTSVEKIIS
jgi:hypothetical protein